ncbi:MAG: hypothetical protein AB2421_14770 [Thermotaleaceae bacterium]
MASARKLTTAPNQPIDDVICTISANLRSRGAIVIGLVSFVVKAEYTGPIH